MNNKIKLYLLVIFSTMSLIFSLYPAFADKDTKADNTKDTAKKTEAVDEKAPVKDGANVEEIEIPANEAAKDDAKKTKTPMKSEAGVNYTVKKGDTLWDLSRRFNNSAWRWPGVWSQNKDITNPHRIYPGQKIKLFYRDDMEQLKKIAKPMKAGTVEMKKESGAVAPVVLDNAPDAPENPSGPLNMPHYHYSKIAGIGFMTDKPAASQGYIFKIKGLDHLMINKGDEIFIKETNTKSSMIPGAKYYSYRVNDPSFIKKRVKAESKLYQREKIEKTQVGYQHYITGIIQITSKKSGYAVGTVIQSFRDIALKDFLIPYTYRSPDIPLSPSKETLEGRIVCSEEGEGEFGDDKIAFIDKGSSEGVKPGQMYNVFYPEEKDSSELFGGKKLFVPVDFGSFIVLMTSPHASTVLITSANKGIAAGDGWHYPPK